MTVEISALICTHNPRPDYFRRVLKALDKQTLPKTKWELLVVDNASDAKLADTWDLAWHPCARHIREDTLGLTPARLRGIAEASGELLIFVDDDNVLAPNYLEEALLIFACQPGLGAFGAGVLAPEFEVEPPPETRPYLNMLALRTVSSPRSSTNPKDWESIPWGAGLCVPRAVAQSYCQLIASLEITTVLGRRGTQLFSGEDDVFSWVAASQGLGFGIFPRLQATHLIGALRLTPRYFVHLLHDHTFSNRIRHYVLGGIQPGRMSLLKYARLLPHGVKNGLFSMRCRWATLRGEHRAAQFILERQLRPLLREPITK